MTRLPKGLLHLLSASFCRHRANRQILSDSDKALVNQVVLSALASSVIQQQAARFPSKPQENDLADALKVIKFDCVSFSMLYRIRCWPREWQKWNLAATKNPTQHNMFNLAELLKVCLHVTSPCRCPPKFNIVSVMNILMAPECVLHPSNPSKTPSSLTQC